MITEESQGKVKISSYRDSITGKLVTGKEKEYDVYLKRVGIVPTGDNASIVVSGEGLIKLFAFDGAQAGAVPVKEDGKLVWKTLEEIGAGDGNDNTTYEFAVCDHGTGIIITPLFNGQPIMDGETQVKYHLDLDVYTKKEVDDAIAEAVAAVDFVDEDELADAIKDFATDKEVEDAVAAEKGRAEKAEAQALADAKTYTNEEIAGLTVAIEQKDGVEHIVVKNKAGEEVASANASKFVQDSFLNDVAYDAETGKITFTWTMGDGSTKTDEVAVADFVQTYTPGTGLKLEDNQFSVDTEVIATVEALNGVKETAEAAQTAQEVSDAIDAKIAAQNLGQYAKTADVNKTLEDYAKSADVVSNTAFGEFQEANTKAIEDAVAAHETAVENKYATKQALADHETAADGKYATKTELSNHETAAANTYATKEFVGNFTTGEDNYKDIATIVGYINKKAEETLAAAQGGSSETAASVALALQNYKNENDPRVQKNTNDISALQGQLSTTNTNVTSNTEAITAINTNIGTNVTPKIAALEAADVEIEKTIGEHTAALETLNTTKIPAIEQSVVNEAKARDDADKAILAKIGAVEDNKTVVDMINAVAGTIDFTPYAKKDEVAATYATITALNEEIARADAAEKANAKAIGELDATLKAALENDGEGLDSIKELAVWIEEHETEILPIINKHTDILAGIGGENQPATVVAAIEAAKYVLPGATVEALGGIKSAADVDGKVAVNKVYVDATTNVAEVKAFSTDNLVQGTMTLVLNGGDAQVSSN